MNEKKIIKLFKEKYDLNITFEPTVIHDKLQHLSHEMHNKVVYSDKVDFVVIEKLKKMIKDGVEIPVFYNYLYIAYIKNGQIKEADQILHETLKKFPDYHFVKMQLVNNYISEGRLDEAKAILGENENIKDIHSQNIFHVSEVFSFYETCFHLAIVEKKQDKAKQLLRALWDLGEKYHYQIKKRVIEYNALKFSFNNTFVHIYMGADYVKEDRYTFATEVDLDLYKKLLIFDFDRNNVDDVLDIPLEELLPKLFDICAYCFACFEELDLEDMPIFINAFGFLSVYKFEPAYPLFLKYLTKDNEFIEFWLEESFEYINNIAYHFGLLDHLPLIEVLKRQHIHDDVRSQIGSALIQLALQKPQFRENVVDACKIILQSNVEKIENREQIPTYFLMFFISDILLLNERSLIEMAKPFFDHNLIDTEFLGDYEAHVNELEAWEYQYAFSHQPENIYEYFSREFELRNKSKPISEKERQHYFELANPTDPFERFLKESFISSTMEAFDEDDDDEFQDDLYNDFEENLYDDSIEKVIKSELMLVHNKIGNDKKIGRNDPCPCGSSKKYKKCCLNN